MKTFLHIQLNTINIKEYGSTLSQSIKAVFYNEK